MQIEIIAATRYSVAGFQKNSALGQSVERPADPQIGLRLVIHSKRGLTAGTCPIAVTQQIGGAAPLHQGP